MKPEKKVFQQEKIVSLSEKSKEAYGTFCLENRADFGD